MMKRRIRLVQGMFLLMLGLGMTACGKGTKDSAPDEAKIARFDGEIAARMENFSVGGYDVGLPCTVGKFMEKFELEYSYPIPEVSDTMCCSYLIDGEPAGVIFVYCKEGKVHDTDYVYAMSVDEFSIVKEQPFAFEVAGIREDMTREQIKELWGEPDSSGTRSIIYCDGEYEDTWDVDKITIGFNNDSGEIDDIAFFVSLDRIEGLEGK